MDVCDNDVLRHISMYMRWNYPVHVLRLGVLIFIETEFGPRPMIVPGEFIHTILN